MGVFNGYMLVRRMCIVGAIVCALLGAGAVPAFGQERDVCQSEIVEAEDAYVANQFGETIRLLSTCLDQRRVASGDVVKVHRLLALAFIQQGQLEQAKLTIVDLLNRRPGYQANPVQDPPSYVSVVSIVKQQLQLDDPVAAADTADAGPTLAGPEFEQERRPWYRSTTFWVVGSGLVVGSVTALLLGGGGSGDGGPGGGPSALPGPPNTP